MKKQITLLALLISLQLPCFAQPTVTYAGIAPQTGVTLITHNGSYQNPGSSGANQTWNFASYSGPTTVSTNAVNPVGTPFGGAYPTATLCHNVTAQNTYQYLEVSTSALSDLGVEGPSFSLDGNPDPKIIMKYPFTFSNTWTDSYEVDGSTSVSFARTGNINATADAYGTLTTPNGTYTNTLRIHITETFSDDFGFAIYSGTTDYYVWYKEGIHVPIFSTAQGTYNGSPITPYGYYSDTPSGLDELTSVQSVTAYPTPANDNLFVKFGNYFSGYMNYELTDMTGRTVLTGELSQQLNNISVENIQAGHYLLKVFSDEAVQVRKVMIQ